MKILTASLIASSALSTLAVLADTPALAQADSKPLTLTIRPPAPVADDPRARQEKLLKRLENSDYWVRSICIQCGDRLEAPALYSLQPPRMALGSQEPTAEAGERISFAGDHYLSFPGEPPPIIYIATARGRPAQFSDSPVGTALPVTEVLSWHGLILGARRSFRIGWAIGLKYTHGFTRLVPSALTDRLYGHQRRPPWASHSRSFRSVPDMPCGQGLEP